MSANSLGENGGVMFTPETTPSVEAFGIEYMDNLYRYALVLTRSRIEAEDLVQETYVRAIEAYTRLRDDSNVKGWLFTILRNLWFNQLRKHRNGPQLVTDDVGSVFADGLADDTPDAHQILEKEEDAVCVRAAISKLPSEFQEILVLRDFEELSYREIAAVLDCPAGTVMSRLGRARARLKVTVAAGRNISKRSGRLGGHEQLR
jgi:RNA polymerase sigma-70 factor, ECF subfamily